MPIKSTSEEFDTKIQHKPFKRLSEYAGSKIKIKFQCNIDGHIWESNPNNILNGNGCPKCSHHAPLGNDYIDKKLENRKIKRIDNYIKGNVKIRFQCLDCDNIWLTKPTYIIHGETSCPKCYIRKLTKTNFNIDKQLKNRKIKRIDNYIKGVIKIRFQCLNKKCKNIWSATPSNILRGNGCPQCRLSKGELKIKNILVKNNIKFTKQKTFNKCKNKRKLRFDFYIHKLKLCIEFDGMQHFVIKPQWGGKKALKYTQTNDEIKNNYCINNGISLLRIPYTELKNIDTILIPIIEQYIKEE
jgi:very-short-patch-repair endonuclease